MIKQFVAVRTFADQEYFDLETLSYNEGAARIKANAIDLETRWMKPRPVVRIAKVQVTEVAA